MNLLFLIWALVMVAIACAYLMLLHHRGDRQ